MKLIRLQNFPWLLLPILVHGSACSSAPRIVDVRSAGTDPFRGPGAVRVEEIPPFVRQRTEEAKVEIPPTAPQFQAASASEPLPERWSLGVPALGETEEGKTPIGREVLAAKAAASPSSAEPGDENERELLKGNSRYLAEGSKSAVQAPSLAERQVRAVVLSCSDSPVAPERAFDLKSEELLVVRVAGHVLGSAQVASVEYAVEKLGAKVIVVLGHEGCEAVRTALQSESGKSAGSTDQDWLAAEIRPNLGLGRIPASMMEISDPLLRKPVTSHVNAVSENLIVRSAVLRQAIEKGSLRVLRGIQRSESGRIDFWK